MKPAKYILDKDYTISEIDKRIYGSFVEHLKRVVYNGIYEPGHVLSDEQGFRNDIIDFVKQLNITLVRYPGGNFVSGYNWTDGIGPIADRPQKLDLAWSKIETNRFGTDEFVDWSRKANVEFMAAVNLGTGTPQDAANMVEYCNHKQGSYWSDLRRENGHEEPHNVKLWCAGNEMDGEWQIGQLSAEDYGKKAKEAAKMMKLVDPSIEIVVCGSCCCEIPTYPDWDMTVLEHTYDYTDYISLHRYYSYDQKYHLFYPSYENQSDVAYFAIDMQNYINTVTCAADFMMTKKKSSKKINISFDEWNVVSNSNPAQLPTAAWQSSEDAGEEVFNLLDALIYGSILCTLIKNSYRIKIACQSLLVNCGGMFYTKKGGTIIKNTVFYPFQHVAAYGHGIALLDKLTGPDLITDHHGEVPALQSAAVFNSNDGTINVFVVNFDKNNDIELEMDLRSFGTTSPLEHIVLNHFDLGATNTYEKPELVKPHNVDIPYSDNGKYKIVIPQISWNVLRFNTKSITIC